MSAQAQLDVAISHHNAGRLQEAEAIYDSILRQYPADFTAQHMLGVAQFQRGRHEAAIKAIGRALELNPKSPDARSNLGLVLLAFGKTDQALEQFEAALTLRPDFPEAHYNCANALRLKGDLDQALEHYGRAIALRPDYAEALCNQGLTLRSLKRAKDAFASFDRVVALQPMSAAAWNNRATALQDLRRMDEALANYSRALALDPAYTDALHNRAMALHEYREDYARAIPDLERLLTLAPDYPFARGALLHFRMQVADWDSYGEQLSAIETRMRAGESVIAPFAYQAVSQDPADLMMCSRIYAARRYPGAGVPRKLPKPKDRIRLGYVGGEFRNHATSILAAGLFEHHDRRKFELLAFDSGGGDGSPMRKRLEASFEHFVDITARGDQDAARAIADLGVDILVNLNGYFGRERMGIFALRPSPVQVNWLGFPATLGADYIDYIIADAHVISQDEDRFYSEKIIRLPNSYQANDNRRVIGQSRRREEFGLPDDAFVFAWFNQSYKLTPAMFDSWTRILRNVPGSVLWLLESNALFAANLRRAADKAGIDPARLIFSPVVNPADHLARLWLADLFLDSLPYNAHTTASDALWAGLPLLTRRGTAFPGRVAASLLQALELPELIVDTQAEFEATAIELARQPERLKELRDRLVRNRLTAPLFDTETFTADIERAYQMMFDIAVSGAPPRSFNV